MSARHISLAALAATTLLLTAPLALGAGGKDNIEEGLPVTVESTYTLEYLGREVQILGRYERTDDGDDSYVVEPRLELGVWWNTELKVATPVLFGDAAEHDGLGPVSLEATYNLNQETFDLPAFSIAGGLEFPTGPTREAEGYDPFVKLLMTRTLGRSWQFHQLHLNLQYQWNDDRLDDERSRRYLAAIGYSRRLNADTVFVADIVREQDREQDVEMNLIEAGLRWQALPQGVLSGGIGFGIGDESPDVRLTLGFQYEF
jgi:hypothetical protein